LGKKKKKGRNSDQGDEFPERIVNRTPFNTAETGKQELCQRFVQSASTYKRESKETI